MMANSLSSPCSSTSPCRVVYGHQMADVCYRRMDPVQLHPLHAMYGIRVYVQVMKGCPAPAAIAAAAAAEAIFLFLQTSMACKENGSSSSKPNSPEFDEFVFQAKAKIVLRHCCCSCHASTESEGKSILVTSAGAVHNFCSLQLQCT